MRSKLSAYCYLPEEKIPVSKLDPSNYVSTENMISNKGGICRSSYLPSGGRVRAFRKGDVLLSNIRIYFKKIWLADMDGGCSNDVLVFRPRENCDSAFLYCLLSSDTFFDYADASSKGTKMPRGDKEAMMAYELDFYDLADQRRIGGYISLINGRIRTNIRINDNLSKQIDAVFDEFYCSILDKEHDHQTLGEVCRCVLGGTPSRANKGFWGGNIPWINSGEVNEFRVIRPSEYITEEGLSHSATKLLPAGTTLLAITGATLGQFSLLEINSCANQSVVGVIPSKTLPKEYVYELIKKNISVLISHQTGGAQQHINLQDVKSLDVLIPTNKEIRKYSSLVRPMFDQIASNCFENDRLARLRDTILSRLINGDLDLEI